MRKKAVRGFLASTFVAALGLLGPASAVAQGSDLVDLGVGTGYGINNGGQVALGQAGIYSNGTTTSLPALPGQTSPASAQAINATGQLAGTAASLVTVGGYQQTGTTAGSVPVGYSNGTLTNISTLLPFYSITTYVEPGTATGINASGQIVGYYQELNPRSIDPPPTNGFIVTNGTAADLPSNPPGAGTQYPPINMPLGINDSGQIVGTVAVADPNSPANNKMDAYTYSNGTWIDIGQGTGYAINATGLVTGALDIITIGNDTDTIIGTYAFLYSNGTTINLGAVVGGTQGAGYAINATGQVVGTSYFSGVSGTHAFLYNGGMNDLNALISATDPLKPYVTLTTAVGINDNMLILANGVDSRTNQAHAYLFQSPLIQIAPGPLNFGTQALGGTSPAQSVSLTNTGAAAIALGAASASSNFSLQSNGCGTSLASGSQCAITVAFAPTMAGALTGALTIPAAEANFQVPLAGIAPITATISASTNKATVSIPIIITWVSSPGSTCTAVDSSQNPSFNGNIPPSGSKALTENAAGTVSYGLHCTAAGTPEVDPVTSVVWAWPAATATLSASPATIKAGQSITLSWTSTNATSCTATGGGSDDNWPGTKATSGSETVVEAVALAASSVQLTFGITCKSATSGLSAAASANVTEDSSTSSSAGGTSSKSGGGELDPLSLVALLGVYGLRRRARSR